MSQAKSEKKSSAVNKILSEAMKFVNRRNPYAWGGKGEALTEANINKLRNTYGEATFRHLTKRGDWGWAVGKSGMKCVDCSGMTQHVFKQAVGIDVGINTTKQRSFGKNIGVKNAVPGDLLVGWSKDIYGNTCGHCGIMGDNGKLIEAKGRRWGCVNEDSPKEAGMTVAFHVVDSEGKQSKDAVGSKSKTQSGEKYTHILTNAQAAAAVRYNKQHNQSICKKIQDLVGAVPDGVFGPATVNKIAAWQKKHGLTPDGQFGPRSKAKAGFDKQSSSNKNNSSKKNNDAKDNKHGGSKNSSGAGASAVALAEKYLYSVTQKYTKDFIKGKPHLKYLIDVSYGGSDYNYGYNCNCANFVSAILQNVGLLGNHYIGVSALKSAMSSEGYKSISRANARPGDIWLNKNGGSHTEIVASNSNGYITLIGSNNAGTKKQRVTYDKGSGNSKGEFYTKK
ncbi:MAG: C40 family peptidase [Proteobacteria bacterium]|nr:C40 family peptidase [Pseudomonadota bacterium]